jgi:hypothetical protein
VEWIYPLSRQQASIVRSVLSRELRCLHRPEFSDLLDYAEFAVDGRTLLVRLHSESAPTLEQAINLAALRGGLPIDQATLY